MIGKLAPICKKSDSFVINLFNIAESSVIIKLDIIDVLPGYQVGQVLSKNGEVFLY